MNSLLLALSLLAIDCGQTLSIANSTEYSETNKILGKYPSTKNVVTYYSVTALTLISANKIFPKHKKALNTFVSFAELVFIANNKKIGVKIRW